MAASAQKIVECGAGAFRSQAILYSSLLVEAYQAANAHVEVSDLRAAVERNNPDGSIEILVPMRVKVTNSETQNQEAGYRLRVTMVSDEGHYRISKLDQVARCRCWSRRPKPRRSLNQQRRTTWRTGIFAQRLSLSTCCPGSLW